MKFHTKKNQSIFAKANIPRGTRVLAESPILNAKASANEIIRVYGSLGPSAQDLYLDLPCFASYAKKRKFEEDMGCDWNEIQGFQRRILSIYAANVFPGGISLLGFRFDHSCIPNIHFQ